MESTLYDPVRCKFVPVTPEEKVRQLVIHRMISELGYPKSLMAVEKEIRSLSQSSLDRRIDILCYAPDANGIRALLLIECKAESMVYGAEKQVMGYNRAIGAPFIALACRGEIRTFWREEETIKSVPFLPRFCDLLAQL